MEKLVITDEYIENMDYQFKIWANYLNLAIGLLAFTLALACLGTDYPSPLGMLAVLVIAMVRSSGSNLFPKEFQDLREKAQEDEKAKLFLEALHKKYFGFKTNFTQYHLFMFGTLFLLAVALFQPVIFAWPILKSSITIIFGI